MLALIMTMLPSVMLSGFIFQIKNMPTFLKIISDIVPAKFFLIVIRGILLKGAGIQTLGIQAVYLLILMTILIIIAALKFKTKVD